LTGDHPFCQLAKPATQSYGALVGGATTGAGVAPGLTGPGLMGQPTVYLSQHQSFFSLVQVVCQVSRCSLQSNGSAMGPVWTAGFGEAVGCFSSIWALVANGGTTGCSPPVVTKYLETQ